MNNKLFCSSDSFVNAYGALWIVNIILTQYSTQDRYKMVSHFCFILIEMCWIEFNKLILILDLKQR